MDDAAAVAVALDRDQQIETGQVATIPHSEMMARLRT
jgi:hypothetical protein